MRLIILCMLIMTVQQSFAGQCPPLLNRTITTLQGDKINLCAYAGKPILIVNTASKCGYTPQFEKLEGLYAKYQQRGLLILGFPSNDFRQELSGNGAIAKFCILTYNVKFPMSEPGHVVGGQANPFFKELAQITGSAPDWNFHKYLISADGKTVYSFATQVEPDSPEIMNKLLPMLK